MAGITVSDITTWQEAWGNRKKKKENEMTLHQHIVLESVCLDLDIHQSDR